MPGVALAQALARIQEASGITFPLPRRWTGPDAAMVYFCDQLLHNGAVAWPWPGGQVNAAAASAAALVASGPLPRMSVSGTGHADATIALFGHQIPLPGVLQMTATNLVVANAPELAALVRQVPPWASVPLVLVADDLTSCAFHLREPTEDREESDPEPAPDADEVNADR